MTIHDHPGKERIDTVRSFNRFYTRQIGLLDEGLLKSPFSLTEARVLYELANRDGLVASDLVRELGLDPGYVSRLLKKFEERGLVEREASEADARRASIALTPAGRQAFAPLNQDSHDQVRALLDRLAPVDQERLVKAMRTVQELLGDKPEPKEAYILRPLQVGDIGWITRRQGMLYTQEYGWDGTFEALVAEILGEFVKKFDPKWERAWIAERAGEVVGSVFVVRKSPEVAKLRLLYVEPSARGLGIGARLVDECIAFAHAKGYKTLTLWTNDILGAARRIYQAAGFKLVEEERHHSFGKDLVGQTWDLEL
ncbi:MULTISPECIES: bifunctional helix-turn-helix transcriptional regulator/GNAT family N-acetyltransferase [unclassified Mesorhizobium]|uniref:bifunctional helix-turn-helix transcriptional regulator/GNAT family N-acetyltransferase n=1 Tax=unclassified Mesorhizobium TaxID=325217 RepID=UPI001129C9B0|nr:MULTISPECIES: bifunctional helix-turn-helix transcriptional regulator/GNAT family N-acetyltransferase [unclassified Mesorhizobium]TPK93955.1 MarR family transcriptional regulator [Mesorhizobium sp. B2-4-16]TPL60620.1 MarR family transcriptional regulator [Mesorhizobium sp. B2-4-3]